MKYCIAILFSFSIGLMNCVAQENAKQKDNSLSLEIGKTGLIFNINFDHKFKNSNAGIRIYAGSNFGKYLTAYSTGAGAYCLVHKNFEIGIDAGFYKVDEVSDDQKGFVLINPDYSISTFYTALNIGYRKKHNNKLFRVGVSPGLINKGFIPGGYISYGFLF